MAVKFSKQDYKTIKASIFAFCTYNWFTWYCHEIHLYLLIYTFRLLSNSTFAQFKISVNYFGTNTQVEQATKR